MWLIMIGQRRDQLTTTEGYQPYRQRYDMEHLLRFEREGRRGFLAMSNHAVGKQRLLLNALCHSVKSNMKKIGFN